MLEVRKGGDFASGMTATGFWMGITAGRIVLGFITPRLGERLAISVSHASHIHTQPAYLLGVDSFSLDLYPYHNSPRAHLLASPPVLRLRCRSRLPRFLPWSVVPRRDCGRDQAASKTSSR